MDNKGTFRHLNFFRDLIYQQQLYFQRTLIDGFIVCCVNLKMVLGLRWKMGAHRIREREREGCNLGLEERGMKNV